MRGFCRYLAVPIILAGSSFSGALRAQAPGHSPQPADAGSPNPPVPAVHAIPPASVTVNGRTIAQGQTEGGRGWTFEGNTLTTVIPTPAYATAERVTIEVRRAEGLIEKRNELDGFVGAMTRLRGAYDALQQSWPVAQPPDALIDVMQTGDRLSYHPEHAMDEITHFHEMLPQAQAAVAEVGSTFSQKLDDYAARLANNALKPAGMEVQKQIPAGSHGARSEAGERSGEVGNQAGPASGPAPQTKLPPQPYGMKRGASSALGPQVDGTGISSKRR